MIKIRIKIKSDTTTFNYIIYKNDDFNMSKSNPELLALVEETCLNSHLQDIQEVRVFSDTEW